MLLLARTDVLKKKKNRCIQPETFGNPLEPGSADPSFTSFLLLAFMGCPRWSQRKTKYGTVLQIAVTGD